MTLLNKEPPKMLSSSFSVGHTLLGMQPLLKSSLFPQRDSWRKLNFYSQVAINQRQLLGQEWESVSTSSFSSRTLSGPELHWPCGMLPQYLGMHMCIDIVDLEDLVLLFSSIPLLSLTFFPPSPLPQAFLSLEGKYFMKATHLVLNNLRSLTVCVLPDCGCRYFLPSAAGRNYLDDG